MAEQVKRLELYQKAPLPNQSGVAGPRPASRTRRFAIDWQKAALLHHAQQQTLGAVNIVGKLNIRMVDEAAVRPFLDCFHYLPEHSFIGRRIFHEVRDEAGHTIAAIGWSNSPALHLERREKYIGSGNDFDWRCEWNNRIIANNTRFCVHNKLAHRENIASRILAMSRKKLMLDWHEKYKDKLLLFETFVDTDRYKGTCYLADNWINVGETKGSNFHGAAFGAQKFDASCTRQVIEQTEETAVSHKIILMRQALPDAEMDKELSRIGLSHSRWHREFFRPCLRPKKWAMVNGKQAEVMDKQ